MRHVIARLACPLLVAGTILSPGCASSPPAPPADFPATKAKVRAGLLNLLQCPSLNCDVIADLRAGQEVDVLSPDMNGWVMVRVPASGREGYVQVRFLAR
jgi:uncharacterized protein YgiM (DUF1202 family)